LNSPGWLKKAQRTALMRLNPVPWLHIRLHKNGLVHVVAAGV
jgi:hypothetical protein